MRRHLPWVLALLAAAAVIGTAAARGPSWGETAIRALLAGAAGLLLGRVALSGERDGG